MSRLAAVILVLWVAGCSTYGLVENKPLQTVVPGAGYSFVSWQETGGSHEDIGLFLAFSGGGTRAAALSYGVLQELRDTPVNLDGQNRRLLDQVDRISAVSGGSFTAAYYGLHGDGIFEDFEEVFLRSDVEGALLKGLFSPLRWFSSKGRTEMAIDYYEKQVFHGATFADLNQPGRPQILINASDLGRGVRFTFTQDYFNLLCSDLTSYPLARAVTASSAVPVLFHPVVVENYANCNTAKPAWLLAAEERAAENPELALTVAGLASYLDKDARKYAHFVDGGITDNLGLRAVYDITQIAGGIKETFKLLKRKPPRHMVMISVNASTNTVPAMDHSNEDPSLVDTIAAVTDVQLHRYNAATIELLDQNLKQWAKELSTPERPVTPYFIQVSFKDVPEPKLRLFFNRVPTSFDLSDEQVDKLIKAGRELLRGNAEFQRLLDDLDRNSARL